MHGRRPLPDLELKNVASLALAEARKRGATQCEVDASHEPRALRHRAPRRGGDRRVSARPRRGRHGVLRQAQGLRQHRGPERAGGARTVEKACTMRATPRRTLRGTRGSGRPGARDSRTWSSIIPGTLTPERPWSWRAPAKRRAWRSMRASPIPKVPRSSTQRGVRVYGNSHGFLAGYREHQPQLQLRAAGAGGRGHAARLLVQHRARREGAAGSRGDRPQGRPSARCAARCAASISTRKAPVLFAPELARGFFGHFVARDPRRRAVPQVIVPAGRGGPAGVAFVRADRMNSRTS